MRFVVLFAAACALGCVAEAAVAPELGYVKLLTGEKGLKCDGTICSRGCCPEPGFDCCSDGSHCANNVASCPGCPKTPDADGINTGGWCKENQDDFGELTEDDPCCQTPDLYCNYDNNHAGTCGTDHVDFCPSEDDQGVATGYTKCGSHCCEDAAEVCCNLENECVPFNGGGTEPDGTECDGYCGGDVCGSNAEECCLPPKICCRDATTGAPSCDDSCPGAPDEESLCDPDHPNVSVLCVDPLQCCPNGINACYTDDTDINTSCPGTPCGDSYYCVGDKPYCCDPATKTCAAHPDDCVTPPFSCTPTGTECTDVDPAKPYCCDGGAACAVNGQGCTPTECTAGPSSPDCTDGTNGYCCPDESTCVADAQECTCDAGPSSPGCINGSDNFCCADGKTCAADVTGCTCTGTEATSPECNDGTTDMYCCSNGTCNDAETDTGCP